MYPPWDSRPALLVCPADPDGNPISIATSYVISYGDAIEQVGSGPLDWPTPDDPQSLLTQNAVCLGVFAKQLKLSFRDILDGTANTVMISEMQIAGAPVARNVRGLESNPSLTLAAQDGKDFWPNGRSSAWYDGTAAFGWISNDSAIRSY